MNIEQTTSNTSIRYLVGFAAFVILVAGLREAASIIVPFLMSVFLAVVATPPLYWLQNKGLPRWLALIVVMLSIVGSASLVAIFMGSSITDFTRSLPEYKAQLQQQSVGLINLMNRYGIEPPAELVKEHIDPGKAMDLVGKLFSGLGNMLTNTFMILLTVIFILTETSSFPKKMQTAFGGAAMHMDGFRRFINNVKQYIVIKTIMSAATGACISLCMWIIGVDYPLLWGLLAFLLNYIPNIGSIIAAIPAVSLAVVQLGVMPAILTACSFIVVNTVVGSIIEPRYMGKGLGLSTLVVFLSLLFWGWVFGPVGMLLSVPLTMFFKIALDSNEETQWISILMDSESAYVSIDEALDDISHNAKDKPQDSE